MKFATSSETIDVLVVARNLDKLLDLVARWVAEALEDERTQTCPPGSEQVQDPDPCSAQEVAVDQGVVEDACHSPPS